MARSAGAAQNRLNWLRASSSKRPMLRGFCGTRGAMGAASRKASRSRKLTGRTPGMRVCSPSGVGSVASEERCARVHAAAPVSAAGAAVSKARMKSAALDAEARRAEDHAVVIAQHLQPGAEVIGVAHGRQDAERGADEGARHLGDQLLARIGLGAEAAGEIAREPRGMAGPVAKLVKAGAVIVDLLEESGLRRNPDESRRSADRRRVAADAEIRAVAAIRASARGTISHSGSGLRPGREPLGQAVALRDVKDGEALEERDGLGLVAVLLARSCSAFRDEAVGIADRGAAFALADMAAHVEGLPKGQPILRGDSRVSMTAPQRMRMLTPE